jgi:rhodanese-related sulfurtransferase
MLAKQSHAVATVADLAPTAPDAAPATPIDDATKEILSRARARAEQEGLKYAGQVTPQDAWALVSAGAAVIVDVRTVEERKYVGHVPDTLHVAWATGTSMNRNPRFVRELEAQVSKDAVVLLLCRSGKRSHAAAEVAAQAGFRSVLNIIDGFEGDLDDRQHRGGTGGWRHVDLPWVQD